MTHSGILPKMQYDLTDLVGLKWGPEFISNKFPGDIDATILE